MYSRIRYSRPAILVWGMFWLSQYFQGCSLSRTVRPVGNHQLALGLHAGGPIFTRLGIPIPVPATAVYARYGLDDIQEIQGAIYPAPIAGPIGFDAGWARQWWSGCDAVPAFMTSAKLALFFNPKALLGRRSGLTGKPYALGVQAFELLDASFSWTVQHNHTLYTGTQWILQIERAIFRPGIMLGYQMAFHKHWHWGIEGSYLALSSYQEHGLVRWLHLNHLGAFGLTMGIEYHFGL